MRDLTRLMDNTEHQVKNHTENVRKELDQLLSLEVKMIEVDHVRTKFALLDYYMKLICF